ncbi:hypothetical protein ACP275_12G056300 [Erythranthe tilingii]
MEVQRRRQLVEVEQLRLVEGGLLSSSTASCFFLFVLFFIMFAMKRRRLEYPSLFTCLPRVLLLTSFWPSTSYFRECRIPSTCSPLVSISPLLHFFPHKTLGRPLALQRNTFRQKRFPPNCSTLPQLPPPPPYTDPIPPALTSLHILLFGVIYGEDEIRRNF